MWISLIVEHQAIPLACLPLVINGTSQPGPLLQNSVFEVKKITALRSAVLIPKNMGRTVGSDSHGARVFNQSRLRVYLLNTPPVILERCVLKYTGRETDMRIPRGIKRHSSGYFRVATTLRQLHRKPLGRIRLTKGVLHASGKIANMQVLVFIYSDGILNSVVVYRLGRPLPGLAENGTWSEEQTQ